MALAQKILNNVSNNLLKAGVSSYDDLELPSKLSSNVLQLVDRKTLEGILKKGLTVRQLEKLFGTQVIFSWNATYYQHRYLYEQEIQELPIFIVVPECDQTLKDILNLAYKYKLSLRPIGGRHSSISYNPDVYIDMSKFNNICSDKTILNVGGGVNQGRIYQFLFKEDNKEQKIELFESKEAVKFPKPLASICIKYHLPQNEEVKSGLVKMLPGGTASSVGIAGLSSAGGVATFKRTVGMAVDSEIAYEIVIPPDNKHKCSRKVIANTCNHSDLFWALRGGVAQNFGLVTSVIYNTPLIENRIIMYAITFDWNQAVTVLDTWLKTAPNRTNNINEDINLHSTTNEKEETNQGIEVDGLYIVAADQTVEDALIDLQKQVNALLTLGGVLTTKLASYAQTITALANARQYTIFSRPQAFFSARVIDSNIPVEALNAIAAEKVPGIHIFAIELCGGRIRDVPNNATAFWPRDKPFFMEVVCNWEDGVYNCQNLSFVKKLFDSLYDPIESFVFVGFPILHLPNHQYAYWGFNMSRLQKVKQIIDPYNVMKYPAGII